MTALKPQIDNLAHSEETWRSDLLMDARKPYSNLANALTILRMEPVFDDMLSFNEMSRDVLLIAEVPAYGFKPQPLDNRRSINDVDVSRLQEWLQRADLAKISRDTVHQAVAARAMEGSFHPIREYLNNLEWDGTRRLYDLFHRAAGAERTPYTDATSTWFLLAMVARIMQPGCKADYAPMLQGEQGIGKSEFGRVLAGDWFSDAMPDLGSKDASLHLRGLWLIEFSELANLSKADSNQLKAFLSRCHERYRPPYGRIEVNEPRQCCFYGTTNAATFLRDETGARRFWPIKCGVMDLDWLAANRDQIFAEAVVSYRGGAVWWPSNEFQKQYAETAQDDAFEDDAWESLIADYLAGKSRVLILDVAHGCLGIEIARIGTADSRRIRAVLQRLGWAPAKRGPNGERFYEPI